MAPKASPRKAEPLLPAVAAGDVAEVERRIEAGADVRVIYEGFNQNLVFFAAKTAGAVPSDASGGQTALLGLLVEKHGLEANAIDINGQTPLFYAAKEGHSEACSFLIEHRCDPGHVDSLASQTALFYASLHCRDACVDLLLERRSPPDQADKFRRTALFYAGSPECVSRLAEGGCDLNFVDEKGLSAAMLHASAGRSDHIKALIDAKADFSLVSKDKKTCHGIAMASKKSEVCKMLERLTPAHCRGQGFGTRRQAASAAEVDTEAPTGASSSSSAPTPGSTRAAKAAAKAPATKSVPVTRSRASRGKASAPASGSPTPEASPASPPGALAAAQQDLGGSPLAVAPPEPMLAPHWVYKNGVLDCAMSLHQAVVQGKVEHIADILKVGKQNGFKNAVLQGGHSWMHVAAARSKDLDALAVCKLLYEYEIDPAKVDDLGQTPLFFAVRQNRAPLCGGGAECARWLMSLGCDANHIDNFGETPLCYAARNDDAACLQELVEAGADVNAVIAQSGYTMLATAIGLDFAATSRALLDAKADVSTRMPKHNEATALFFAATPELVDLLLAHRSNIEERDCLERTPLMIAAFNGGESVVQALVKLSASVKVKDKEGETCLTLAAQRGSSSICKFLIEECGMDENTRTRKGPTVRDLLSAGDQVHEMMESVLGSTPKKRRGGPTDEAFGELQEEEGELREYTIAFKDADGSLLEFGSPEYLDALKELQELCPELQGAWDTQGEAEQPELKQDMSEDTMAKWIEVGSEDDVDDALDQIL